MNKQEILALKCRNITKGNIKCFTILMELVDAGREDIVTEIHKLMNANYGALTPEQIVAKYDECGGKEGFLKRCNSIFTKKNINMYQKEYEYEEQLKQYACGERKDHPDGTLFDESGKEIKYE
jgi:hypothetical protein